MNTLRRTHAVIFTYSTYVIYRDLELHNSPTYIHHTSHTQIALYGTVLLLHYCNIVRHKHLLVLWECAPIGVDQKAEWVATDPG